MKKSHILLLIFAILLSSCRPVMMKYYIKTRIENEQSLIRKAKRFGFGTNNIVSSNSDNFLHILNGQGIPDLKFMINSEIILNLSLMILLATPSFLNLFKIYTKILFTKLQNIPTFLKNTQNTEI